MAKFYIECGEIKDVLNAENPLDACVCSIMRRMQYNLKHSKNQSCDLAKTFIVNEKGFVSDREQLEMDSLSECFIDIEKVFEELNKI